MRIITGKAKGLKLYTLDTFKVRPTSDRVKEAMFSILGNKVIGAMVLDLFSGTGNLALEAWSRGAKKVVCIDNDTNSLKTIRKNVEKAQALDHIKIYRNNSLKSINDFFRKNICFDLIFCDPPYNKGFAKAIIEQIEKYNILNDNGILVIETSKEEVISFESSRLYLYKIAKYGDTVLNFITFDD